MIDLSKCNCLHPGFCPIFNRTMGNNPPDWMWCQKTSEEERKKYRNLLLKAPPSKNQKLIQLYDSLKKQNKEKWFYLYLITENEYHKCDISSIEQKRRNEKIIEYIENQNVKRSDFSNIEILCLGHSEKQLDTIEDRPYITKIDLNHVDAGKYSDNQWSESRAFIAEKNLFRKNTDFIGFTTASWNCKYEFNRIDNFHNWQNAKVLINSKPEDKIVLCADIFCPCAWISENNIISSIIHKNATNLSRIFLRLVKLEDFKHIKVPYSNQMILHKSLFNQYFDYLTEFDVFEKINWIYVKYLKSYFLKDDYVKQKYVNSRIKAYMIEMFTCFWFSKQDFVYIPNAQRKENWYDQKIILERIRDWN